MVQSTFYGLGLLLLQSTFYTDVAPLGLLLLWSAILYTYRPVGALVYVCAGFYTHFACKSTLNALVASQ